MENPVLNRVIVEDAFEAFCEAILMCEKIDLIRASQLLFSWLNIEHGCQLKLHVGLRA